MMMNDFDSIKDADVILVIDSNTTEINSDVESFIRERISDSPDNASLILCGPRRIELASNAAIYMQQKTGTDAALINCMINVIIKEELHNEEFIENHTENFDELIKSVYKYTPQAAEQITGVPREQIIDAAWTYANGKNSAIFYIMETIQHTDGACDLRALSNLALLRGMLKGLFRTCPTLDHPGNPIIHVEEFALRDGKASFIPAEWSYSQATAEIQNCR